MDPAGSAADDGLIDRRATLALFGAAAAAASGCAVVPAHGTRSFFLAAVGSSLTSYRVDADTASLMRAGALQVSQPVQYAWPHPRLPLVYVVFANRSANSAGAGLATLRVGQDGDLTVAFAAVPLPNRPIHVSTDTTGRMLFVAYNEPSGFTVHPVADDGRPGAAIPQPGPIDGGTYAHQVRLAPDGRTIILATRGNDAAGGRPEDPGALKTFHLDNGRIEVVQSVAPNGGMGFGPRHLDFHPTQPWVYVVLERQSELHMYLLQDGRLAERPSFVVSTLADPSKPKPRQLAGTVHLSTDGRFAYVGNRADAVTKVDGQDVFVGGENNIAVFRIDPGTGQPTRIQSIGTRSFNPRTFALDGTGRVLVAAAIRTMRVREGANIATVPAALTIFRVLSDGQLEYVRKIDVDIGDQTMFWSGMVSA